MADTKEVKTKAQRALEMKQKLIALQEEAKTELLDTANQAIKELAELGFSYRLLSEEEFTATQRPASAPTKRATRSTPKAKEPAPGPSANFDSSKECPICKIKGHDGRAHRSQDPKVKFSGQELSERGLLPEEVTVTYVAGDKK